MLTRKSLMYNQKTYEGLPLVTVVTVVYNAVDTIEATILSVINQTYPNIEYIVIDGYSIDGTVDIIKKYEDKITYWLSEPDKGIYDAMNKGVRKAHGEWIHFRNAGDYFYKNDVVERLLSKPIDADVKIIHGNCRIWDKYGYHDCIPPVLSRSYKEAMPVYHPSAFIRSDLHKSLLFDTSYKLSGDYKFFYECYERGIKVEYYPILISIFNTDGCSVKQWKKGMYEDYKLRGGKWWSICFLMFGIKYIRLSVIEWIKCLLPEKIIDEIRLKQRVREGWIITNPEMNG